MVHAGLCTVPVLYSCARARASLDYLPTSSCVSVGKLSTNTAECYLNAFYRFEITPAFSKSSLQYLWIVENIKQSKGMTPSVTILKA
jgi:hypothetical protein